jgi:rhodanese-related sulfurtransferase/SHS2 domain-containing protein
MPARPDMIDPEVASEYLDQGRAQLLDARPTLAYQRSREDLPGAVHVDPGGGAAMSDALFSLPRELLFIAYCDEPEQAASARVARRVRELGIGDGCYLAGGLRCWREAGLPVDVTFAAHHLADADQRGGRADGGGYRIEQTTTGARLSVPGASLEVVFANAARAVMDVLGTPLPGEAPSVELTVRARHPEALFALWIGEILAHARTASRLYPQISILALTAEDVRAGLTGAEVAAWRLDPAAVTLDDVSHERRPEGFAAIINLGFVRPTA